MLVENRTKWNQITTNRHGHGQGHHYTLIEAPHVLDDTKSTLEVAVAAVWRVIVPLGKHKQQFRR